ncbi:MAG: hypothetical protein AAGH88_13790 [Planctomycetota bacterium]
MPERSIPNPRPMARLLLVLTFLAAAPALAQDIPGQGQRVRPDNPAAEPDRWLTDQRWGELRYGLTIRQPKNATLFEQTRDGALARWMMPNGANIGLSIHRGVHYIKDERGNVRQQRIHLNTVVADVAATLKAGGAGVSQIARLDMSKTGRVHDTRSDQWVKVGELMGWNNYYVIAPLGDDEPWFFGLAVLQLDDSSLLTLRLECPAQTIVESVCSFESMLQSVEVETAGDVAQRIRGWVDAGESVIESITPEQYRAAMRTDRLYVIRESERVIGYQRVWVRHQDTAYYDQLLARLQRRDPDARLNGIDAFKTVGNKLVIQSHYEAGDVVIDTTQEFIDEDSGNNAYWELKSRLQERDNPRSPITGAWVETGLRGMANFQNRLVDQIQVIREGTPPRQMTDFVLARERDPQRRLRFPSARSDMVPSGATSSHRWATPPRAYLSSVDAWIVPSLLPSDRAQTYAFFAYHPESTTVAWRIMRVEPAENGGKTVYLRPTIDLAEQAMEFDADGELVRWTFHDGRVMERITREELNRIWRTR